MKKTVKTTGRSPREATSKKKTSTQGTRARGAKATARPRGQRPPTETTETTRAPQSSRAQLQTLFSQMPIPTVVYQKTAAGWVLKDYNQAMRALTRGAITALAGRTAAKVYAARPDISERIARCFQEQALVEYTTPVRDSSTEEETILNLTFACIAPDRVLVQMRDVTESTHAEEALRMREQAFRALAEHSPDVIERFGRDLRCLYSNRAVFDARGSPDSAPCGDLLDDVPIPKAEIELRKNEIRQVFESGQPTESEFEIEADTGNRWFHASFVPEFATDGSVATVLVVSRDLTERKRAEDSRRDALRALRETSERLQFVVDSAPLSLWAADREGKYTMLAGSLTKMLGLRNEDLIGQSVFERARSRPDILESLRCAYRGEQTTSSFEWLGRILEIRYAPMKDAQGQVVGMLGVSLDVSEQRRAEESLRQATRELQRLNAELEQRVRERTVELEEANVALENEIDERRRAEERASHLASFPQLNPNPVIESDMAGRIVFSNPATHEVLQGLGVDREGVEILLPVDLGQVLREWDKKHATSLYREVGVKERVFGETVTLVPQLQVARIYAYDITERKQAEMHIRKLNQDLELRAQDLEMMTEELRVTNEELHIANEKLRLANEGLQVANEELEGVAESMALDLRSPLVSIRHLARMISEDYAGQLPGQVERCVELIHANTQEMDQLTGGLVELARIIQQPLQKQTVAPEAIVRAVLKELEPQWQGRQVQITVGALPVCQADPALLHMIWSQLLANAVKFTRERAVAHIEIGYQTPSGVPSACGVQPGGGSGTYFIRDNGVGFSMEYGQTIFRAFQRYHRDDEYEGAGVGLAIVQRIVRRHGGRVWAEAELDKGAKFFFTLAD